MWTSTFLCEGNQLHWAGPHSSFWGGVWVFQNADLDLPFQFTHLNALWLQLCCPFPAMSLKEHCLNPSSERHPPQHLLCSPSACQTIPSRICSLLFRAEEPGSQVGLPSAPSCTVASQLSLPTALWWLPSPHSLLPIKVWKYIYALEDGEWKPLYKL